MSGGLTDDLLKAAGQGLIAGAFKRLKLQLARRGAELKSPADYDGFEDLLNEALDVLAGSSGDRVGEGVVGFKAFLSKRPEAFQHERYRRWIGDPRSRKLVKQAVYADARREDFTPILLELRDVFADVTGERSVRRTLRVGCPVVRIHEPAQVPRGERSSRPGYSWY
jgi:hypothetical protein